MRLEVYRLQDNEDGQGGSVRLPVLVDTPWGNVDTVSPFRRAALAQLQQVVTHSVRLRYSLRVPEPTDEIHFRDHNRVVHVLSVRTVVDVNLQAKVVRLDAEEIAGANRNNPQTAP